MAAAHIAYLSLGSNIGDRKQNLDRALEILGRSLVIQKVSSIYDTEAVTEDVQPRFLNLACRVRTALNPEQLLSLAKSIEQEMGPHEHDRPRIIDIDILLYDQLMMKTADLVIPHPRMAERAFVLAPLAEIAPEIKYPGTTETISSLFAKVKDKHEVRRWQPDREDTNV